jgi:hypothetical protein
LRSSRTGSFFQNAFSFARNTNQALTPAAVNPRLREACVTEFLCSRDSILRMEKHMKIRNVFAISALSVCGLSLCFSNFTPIGHATPKTVLQADSPMPPPVPIKKPGSGSRMISSPVAIQIADSPMPPPVPIKKPGGALRNIVAPGTVQIADSPMPPPVPIKKPGTSAAV